MITQTKKFYYVESKGDHINVTHKDFPDGPLPLMWNNQGLIVVVTVDRVEAMIDGLTNYGNLPKKDRNPNIGQLFWDDLQQGKGNPLRPYIILLRTLVDLK